MWCKIVFTTIVSQMSNWNYYLALNSDAQMLVSAEFIEGNKVKLCVIVKLKWDVEIFLLCLSKKNMNGNNFLCTFVLDFWPFFLLAFFPLLGYIVSIQKKNQHTHITHKRHFPHSTLCEQVICFRLMFSCVGSYSATHIN